MHLKIHSEQVNDLSRILAEEKKHKRKIEKENEKKRKNGLILKWREAKKIKVEMILHATKWSLVWSP